MNTRPQTLLLIYSSIMEQWGQPDARDLAERTRLLFGRDLERQGVLHECYEPDSGEPITCPGFQNWNLLALKMG